jgi:hypothetical protein
MTAPAPIQTSLPITTGLRQKLPDGPASMALTS